MIKAKNGIVKLRGNAIDLFSELGLITKALRYELKEELTEENFLKKGIAITQNIQTNSS